MSDGSYCHYCQKVPCVCPDFLSEERNLQMRDPTKRMAKQVCAPEHNVCVGIIADLRAQRNAARKEASALDEDVASLNRERAELQYEIRRQRERIVQLEEMIGWSIDCIDLEEYEHLESIREEVRAIAKRKGQ